MTPDDAHSVLTESADGLDDALLAATAWNTSGEKLARLTASPSADDFAMSFGEDVRRVLTELDLNLWGAYVVTQHRARADDRRPGTVIALGEQSAAAIVVDMARVGVGGLLNDRAPLLGRLVADSAGGARPTVREAAPAYVPPRLPVGEPSTEPQAPAASSADTPRPATASEEAMWEAFEETVQAFVGRSASKVTEMTRKASVGKSGDDLVAFLTSRLEGFGPDAVTTFTTRLGL